MTSSKYPPHGSTSSARDLHSKPMIEGPFTGGCLCGAIRYEVDRIFDVIYCHCKQCRRSSGAPVLLTAQVSGDAFQLTKGSPSEYRTSDSGRSLFCGTCGAGLYGEYAPPNHPLVRDGRYFSVRVGTLDDPNRFTLRSTSSSRANSRGSKRPINSSASRATLCRIRTSAETANDSDLMDRGPGAPRPERVRCGLESIQKILED